MDKKLLVCIAFHYIPEKLVYLKKIIENFSNYDLDVTIIIDTNSYELLKYINYTNVIIFVNAELEHPYYLAWFHRKHIIDLLNDYDYFMYTEDDIFLPYENFVKYLENFNNLFPMYIPSFIRLEDLECEYFVVDIQKAQKIMSSEIIFSNGERFISLDRPYHGFWIMPGKELKETMISAFVRKSISREFLASYPIGALNKKPLVMLNDDNKISSLCYSYHLPNTYVNMKGLKHKFGKIKLKNLVEII